MIKFQVEKFEHGRHPIKEFDERYQDSNEDYQLDSDQIKERYDESELKPSVKRIVRHKIENNEVKHQASSNEIGKIFSKDYSKLFKNESSDGIQQNSPESEGVQISNDEGKVINSIFSQEQNNIQNSQNDSTFDINRNSDTDSIETTLVNDAGRVAEHKEDVLSSSSGRNVQKIYATENSELDVNKDNGEYYAHVVDTEEYATENEYTDYNDDYAQVDSHDYYDYNENKEYGINYNAQARDYGNQMEDTKNYDNIFEYGINYDEQDIDYNSQMDGIHNIREDTHNDKLENEEENKNHNDSAVMSQEKDLKNKEVTLQNTLEDKLANDALENEVIDYSGDYSHANDDFVDYKTDKNTDYFTNSYDEQYRDYQIENFNVYDNYYDSYDVYDNYYDSYDGYDDYFENNQIETYPTYDDYLENNEYSINHYEQDTEYGNQIEDYDTYDNYEFSYHDNYYSTADFLDIKSQNERADKDVSVQVKVQA